MADATYDVCCIGNAIVDVLTSVEDAFLTENGFDKGICLLYTSPSPRD